MPKKSACRCKMLFHRTTEEIKSLVFEVFVDPLWNYSNNEKWSLIFVGGGLFFFFFLKLAVMMLLCSWEYQDVS